MHTRLFSYSFLWVITACATVIFTGLILNLTLLGLRRHPATPQLFVAGGDALRGKAAIERYGCGGCHVIPGIRGAQGRVGPQLTGIAHQSYLGGMIANLPENMIRWIEAPQSIAPGTAMPTLGVSPAEARDIAAYLYYPEGAKR